MSDLASFLSDLLGNMTAGNREKTRLRRWIARVLFVVVLALLVWVLIRLQA